MPQLANLPCSGGPLLRLNAKDGMERSNKWALLKQAEQEFDLLITGDRNLSFQQVVSTFNISVVVLHAESTQLHHTILLMPKVASLLSTLKPGEIVDIYP